MLQLEFFELFALRYYYLVVLMGGYICTSDTDSGKSDKGIDKSIFVKPATFHLTLLMLKLWNEDRVQAAADCLQV